MRRPRSGGRFVVLDKTIPSFDAALAYAAHRAYDRETPGTVYVREIGKEGVAGRADKTESGVVQVTGR